MYNTIGNEVDAALNYLNNNWNTYANATWDGNLDHPYGMWAIYKGLDQYGFMTTDPGPDGILGTSDDFQVGTNFMAGIGSTNVAGGITIGQDWDPQTSLAGDWFSKYCDRLVSIQNPNGSWTGYSYWYGALATGWYINILNATGTPEPVVPVPAAVLLGAMGLSAAGWRLRRRGEL